MTPDIKALNVELHDYRTQLKKLVERLRKVSIVEIDTHDSLVESIIFTSNCMGKIQEYLSKV